jgi:hypothetical protein
MITYTAGYKYQLRMNYLCKIEAHPTEVVNTQFLTLSPDGTLQIAAGYAWDGPSGPTIDTMNFMEGSLVHDALYQLMRYGLLEQKWRKAADLELYNICIKYGMSRIRAWWVYKGVRWGAGAAANPKSRKPLQFTQDPETKTAPETSDSPEDSD